MDTDTELLRRFTDVDAHDAFAALVQRKIGLVDAAALRQTACDAHLAQDVTQAVFLALAARAQSLRRGHRRGRVRQLSARSTGPSF